MARSLKMFIVLFMNFNGLWFVSATENELQGHRAFFAVLRRSDFNMEDLEIPYRKDSVSDQ